MALSEPVSTSEVRGVALLTDREREILALVDRHFTSKEIARDLGIGVRTVDTYCDRARKKLGAPDRYVAARMLAMAIVVIAAEVPTRALIGTPFEPLEEPVRKSYGQALEPLRTDELLTGPQIEPHEHGRSDDERGPPDHLHHARVAERPRGLGEPGRAALPDVDVGGPQGGAPELRDDASGGVGDPGRAIGVAQAGPVQASGDGSGGPPEAGGSRSGPHVSTVDQRLAGGRRNDLSIPLRLGAIALITLGSALAFGSVLAALHALSSLLPPAH